MKRGRVDARYDDTYTKATRTFPLGKTLLMIAILIAQIVLVIAACCYTPKPQDIIRAYDVTVEPQSDGSLDISYHFIWEAVDTSQELTWIQIGMANAQYSVYKDSVSDTIRRYTQENSDDEVHLRLDLDRAYYGGETVEFSFRINQRAMLCRDTDGTYFYEFIPGWFNAVPVESYTFRWADDGTIRSVAHAQKQDGFYTFSGKLANGEYCRMRVKYDADRFVGCRTVDHEPFRSENAYDALASDKFAVVFLVILVIALLIIVQVWMVDSVVSYHRGRGFLSGHGFYIHAYGRSNPYYIRARDKYNAKHSSTHSHHRGGSGCACACACACAGGGRAGCSQKDTYTNITDSAL